MLRITFKNLWAHKLRFTLTGVAIVLGVAFMAGTMVLTNTMSKTFDDTFAVNNAGTDVVVQQPQTVDTRWSDVRERVPASAVDTVSAVDGVRHAVGSVQGFTQLVLANGKVASLDGVDRTVGANWIDDATLNPFQLRSGTAPTGDDDVVLDQKVVDENGWSIGDTVTVLAQGEPVPLTLVGTAAYGDSSAMPGVTLVATSDATAQRLFAQPGHYDSILVSATDGVDQTTLASRVDDALGAGTYEVQTGADRTASQQKQFKDDLSFFNTFLLTFAFVALFVGTFIIYNTFTILAAQRSKDMAMLRAIGASRRQLLRSMVAESAVLGVLAGAVGLVAGVGMAYALKGLFAAVGIDLPDTAMVVSTGTVVTAFVVGVSVTVVSALIPALKASRVRPLAALRDASVDRSGVSIGRTVSGVMVTALGIAAFAAGVAGTTNAVALLGVGSLTIVMGLFVLGPVIASPVVRLLGWPARRVSGVTGELARQNATRSPRRTSATASALMVGVALVGFITILASSSKASVANAVGHSLRAEYVVDSDAWTQGGLNPVLADQLRAVPGVDGVVPTRMTQAAVDGASTFVTGVDVNDVESVYDIQPVAGSIEDVGPGEVAVKKTVADDHGWTIGSTVETTFTRTGQVPLTVAAIYDEGIGNGEEGNYLVDMSTYEANVTDQLDQQLFVDTAVGADTAATRASLESALGSYPNATLQDRAQYQAAATGDIDQMLNLMYGLLLLAVVIALIGIANTLALSIHERRREIGLLRAVGMTRGQVRSSVRWESLLIALLGTALGAVVAVGGAWGIVQALSDQGVTTFRVPGAQLLTIVVLAAGAGVVAALGPARRAARLDVLETLGAG